MEQFSALLIMSIRFGIAGLVLVWFTKPPWGHMREIFVVALIGSTIQYGLTYNGLKGIDASTAAILVQLEGPILALMGTILLKEKLGLTRALGMGFAFLGVFIIAGEPRLDGHIDSVILLVAGSTVWAVAQIMISRIKGLSGITILAWVAIMATPQMLIASLIIEDGQWHTFTFNWNAASKELSVLFKGNTIITHSVDIVKDVCSGTSKTYFNFGLGYQY